MSKAYTSNCPLPSLRFFSGSFLGSFLGGRHTPATHDSVEDLDEDWLTSAAGQQSLLVLENLSGKGELGLQVSIGDRL